MRFLKSTLLLLAVACLFGCSAPVQETAIPVPGKEGVFWELLWQDEFDDPALNPENWIAETGAGGWGNNEWQYYTDRSENLRIEDGLLVIEAREEDYHDSNYTSARVKTQQLHSWTYGRIEARLKLPTGKGVWSAFWMLGEDIVSAGWPNSGEIDIMENIGQAQTVYGTVHGPGYSGGDGIGGSFSVTGEPLHADFHVYAIEWQPGEIRWYLDDSLFNIITDEQVPGAWVYDHPFFILLNLAVGGNWPGYPDETTRFPQQLLVDYVRVYRDPTLSIEEPRSGVLHVADITMELQEVDEKWQGTAYVTVVDHNGDPVEGVVVTAGWLGVGAGATKEGKTGQDGIAGSFVGTKTSAAKEISFCISDLAKSQYTYDKDANAKTCVFMSP
jgi:beta-glucanase (GH16 family)